MNTVALMSNPLPTLFLSHGAPDVVLRETAARTFLSGLAESLPRPRAIVVISAHWEEASPTVESGKTPHTIHDFGGFPQAMYQLKYPAYGDVALAQQIVKLMSSAGFSPRMQERGFDHGVWTPLLLAWPGADIPVVPISLVRQGDGILHHRLGVALEPLRHDGVLVIGSGSAVHNLQELAPGRAPAPWAVAFDDWLVAQCEAGDVDVLTHWQQRAPDAHRAHPTAEHFTPLLVAFGAAGQGARGRILHRSWDYGNLAMTAVAFT
jgi:4,5-DOPA dioxygenase extradiol